MIYTVYVNKINILSKCCTRLQFRKVEQTLATLADNRADVTMTMTLLHIVLL